MKLRYYPRRVRYKLRFYRKLKKNDLCRPLHVLRDDYVGFYYVTLLEACKLQYYQFKSLHLLLLPLCRGKVKFRFFSNFQTPLTVKTGLRMGTGAGKFRHWVSEYKKGDIAMVLSYIKSYVLRTRVLNIIKYKFPARIKIRRRFLV